MMDTEVHVNSLTRLQIVENNLKSTIKQVAALRAEPISDTMVDEYARAWRVETGWLLTLQFVK
jgi:hypothetical protein